MNPSEYSVKNQKPNHSKLWGMFRLILGFWCLFLISRCKQRGINQFANNKENKYIVTRHIDFFFRKRCASIGASIQKYFIPDKSPSEDQFIIGLLELQYNPSIASRLKPFTHKIPWAKGWPENNQSFWNAEAFMWQKKIDLKIRKRITEELQYLKGRNLDIGCGSYSYIPSVGFDLSLKMLDFNDHLIEKVPGDLEQPLPFQNNSFDSVTAIFVLNYIHKYNQLFSEIKRILKLEGSFVMILSENKIKEWQRQKEVNSFSAEKWISRLEQYGFSVKMKKQQNLLFFTSKFRM